jgi:hypothetical protein
MIDPFVTERAKVSSTQVLHWVFALHLAADQPTPLRPDARPPQQRGAWLAARPVRECRPRATNDPQKRALPRRLALPRGVPAAVACPARRYHQTVEAAELHTDTRSHRPRTARTWVTRHEKTLEKPLGVSRSRLKRWQLSAASRVGTRLPALRKATRNARLRARTSQDRGIWRRRRSLGARYCAVPAGPRKRRAPRKSCPYRARQSWHVVVVLHQRWASPLARPARPGVYFASVGVLARMRPSCGLVTPPDIVRDVEGCLAPPAIVAGDLGNPM